MAPHVPPSDDKVPPPPAPIVLDYAPASESRRRLIAGRRWHVTVIEPAGWFHGARLIGERTIRWDPPIEQVSMAIASRDWQISAGSADPSDRSRWIVPYAVLGVMKKLEYQLHDDDTVTASLLDPEGTLARVEEARRKLEGK